MKKIIIALVLVFLPVSLVFAASDYYLKIDGVEGETTKAAEGTSPLTVAGKGTVGQTFILDGTKSQDDGTVNRFLWKQTGGLIVKISNSTDIKASFVPTQAGTYVFELTVTDSNGRTSVGQKVEFIVGNNPPTTGTVATQSPKPQEGGNVEFEWKVEEGEKLESQGVEPDEIDYDDDGQPLTPDFSILLGGGSDDSEEAQQARSEVAKILMDGMAEEGKPAETLSLNFEEVKVQVKQNVKLFGFVSVPAVATINIDRDENVKVKFPWWAFLASGKNGEELGQEVFTTISNVLKTKHDTVKNSISNIR